MSNVAINIAAEFVMAKYNSRKITYKEGDQQKVTQYKKPEGDLLLSVVVDVGPSTYYSEQAGMQALDNLLMNQFISTVQYLERVSKFNIIPDCDGLIKELKEKAKEE